MRRALRLAVLAAATGGLLSTAAPAQAEYICVYFYTFCLVEADVPIPVVPAVCLNDPTVGMQTCLS